MTTAQEGLDTLFGNDTTVQGQQDLMKVAYKGIIEESERNALSDYANRPRRPRCFR